MINLDLTIHKTMLNFSDKLKQQYMSDIDSYFINDDWCKHVPHYQTWPVLFDRTESHWIDLKNKITDQVKQSYDINNLKCKAWAYVCLAGEDQNYNNQGGWHSHDKCDAVFSAIYYLNSNEQFEATEFMDINGDVYRPRLKENMLLYFDSKIVHRPAIWNGKKHKQNRYVISVDYRK